VYAVSSRPSARKRLTLSKVLLFKPRCLHCWGYNRAPHHTATATPPFSENPVRRKAGQPRAGTRGHAGAGHRRPIDFGLVIAQEPDGRLIRAVEREGPIRLADELVAQVLDRVGRALARVDRVRIDELAHLQVQVHSSAALFDVGPCYARPARHRGLLLEQVGAADQTSPLAEHVASVVNETTALVPSAPAEGAPYDKHWRLLVNVQVQPDL
jgi:hypothetical protein